MTIKKQRKKWNTDETALLEANLYHNVLIEDIFKHFPDRSDESVRSKVNRTFGYKMKKGRFILKTTATSIIETTPNSSISSTVTVNEDLGINHSSSISKSAVKTKSDKDINTLAIKLLEDNKFKVNIENIYRASLIMKEGA